MSRLAILLHEVLHELDDLVYGLVMDGIVKGDAVAAHEGMAEELLQALSGGLLGEKILQLAIAFLDAEHAIHARTVSGVDVVAVKSIRIIDEIVDHTGALDASLLDVLQGAELGLHVLEGEIDQVQDVGRRGVVDVRDRNRPGLILVAEDSRAAGERLFEEIVTDNDTRGAGGAEVFTGGRVDDTVLGDVDGAGEQGGSHVSAEDLVANVGVNEEFEAGHGFVCGAMNVLGILGELPLRDGADGGFVVIFGVVDDLAFAPLAVLGHNFLGPDASVNEIGLGLVNTTDEIHGDGGELSVGTPLEEEHVVVVRNLEELAHVGNQLLEDGLDGAINVTVRAFHKIHAEALVIQELVLGLVKDFLKNARRTGREVVSALGTLVTAPGSGNCVNKLLDIVLTRM